MNNIVNEIALPVKCAVYADDLAVFISVPRISLGEDIL